MQNIAKWLVVVVAMAAIGACGSTYSLRTGGWKIEAMPGGGACLHVHGDGADVARVCIKDPEPLRLPPETLARICAPPHK